MTLTDAIYRMMSSLLISITYGVEPKRFDHPYIELSEKAIAIAAMAAAPGAFLVDILPLCEFHNPVVVFTQFRNMNSKTCTGLDAWSRI